MMELSIVVPLYNEEDNAKPLLDQIKNALAEYDYEMDITLRLEKIKTEGWDVVARNRKKIEKTRPCLRPCCFSFKRELIFT